MKRIRSVTIHGNRWPVKWRSLRGEWGLCSRHEKTIEMDTHIEDNVTAANILIHEMLHGIAPQWDEDAVSEAADDLTTALIKAGLIADDD